MARLVWSTQRKINIHHLMPPPHPTCMVLRPIPDKGFIACILKKTCGSVRDLVIPKCLQIGDESLRAISEYVIWYIM